MRKEIFAIIISISASLAIRCEATTPPYIPAILEIEAESEISELEDMGVEIWHRRGNLLLSLVPRDFGAAEKVRRKRGVRRFEYGHQLIPTMDLARGWYDADKIAIGENLPQAYTGKGVVVGFCDRGFDPLHVAFLDAEGNPRVKKWVVYDEPQGTRKFYSKRGSYNLIGTDDNQAWHATHVANILAGGYKGNEFRGMAPDAEIIATTSRLYDVGVLAGAEEIIAYAQSVGKPAVINMSLGTYNGPHDGTSLFCRYLDMLAEDAIVCISAGNEGNSTNSYRIAAEDTKREWQMKLLSRDWKNFEMYGMTDIWSDDSTPAEIYLYIVDTTDGSTIFKRGPFNSTDDFEYYLQTDEDAELAQYYDGAALLFTGISPQNGRWYAEFQYNLTTDIGNEAANNRWSRYQLAVGITAAEGHDVDIHTDAQYSRMQNMAGFKAPGGGLTVSDMATGKNSICVGMYQNRESMTYLNGEVYNFDIAPGVVNLESGYGTLADGTVLPHTVAPGGGIISACNTKYVENMGNWANGNANYKEKVGDTTYYWAPQTGTSMSSPYVAGAIACMLEADPAMDVKGVKRVLAATNTHDFADPADPRNGQGFFNPYEAMKQVVGGASVTPGIAEPAAPRMIQNKGKIEIYNPSASLCVAEIYSTSGSLMMREKIDGYKYHEIELDALSKGVYVVTLRAGANLMSNLKVLK